MCTGPYIKLCDPQGRGHSGVQLNTEIGSETCDPRVDRDHPPRVLGAGLRFTNFDGVALWLPGIPDFEHYVEVEPIRDGMQWSEALQHGMARGVKVLSPILPLSELYAGRDEATLVRAAKGQPRILKYILNPSQDVCMAAVSKWGIALKYVGAEMQRRAPQVCTAAVTHSGNALAHVETQTPELCMAAVQQNGMALRYVRNKTREICMAAVRQKGMAIGCISRNQTPELCLAAVQQNGLVLRFVRERTPEICTAAVLQNAEALRYVPQEMRPQNMQGG